MLLHGRLSTWEDRARHHPRTALSARQHQLRQEPDPVLLRGHRLWGKAQEPLPAKLREENQREETEEEDESKKGGTVERTNRGGAVELTLFLPRVRFESMETDLTGLFFCVKRLCVGMFEGGGFWDGVEGGSCEVLRRSFLWMRGERIKITLLSFRATFINCLQFWRGKMCTHGKTKMADTHLKNSKNKISETEMCISCLECEQWCNCHV